MSAARLGSITFGFDCSDRPFRWPLSICANAANLNATENFPGSRQALYPALQKNKSRRVPAQVGRGEADCLLLCLSGSARPWLQAAQDAGLSFACHIHGDLPLGKRSRASVAWLRALSSGSRNSRPGTSRLGRRIAGSAATLPRVRRNGHRPRRQRDGQRHRGRSSVHGSLCGLGNQVPAVPPPQVEPVATEARAKAPARARIT